MPGTLCFNLNALHGAQALDCHEDHGRVLDFVIWRNMVIVMREFMKITKSLSDETRIRTLLALKQGELCVCQITEIFGLAPSTISKHLSILSNAGLVESRKDGRWIYYQWPKHNVSAVVSEALGWINSALTRNPHVLEDARQLEDILKQDPAVLCKKQGKRC